MHWVWNHSQSKGNTRLALLFVADQVRTPACEVRISYPDFMTALNASSKSTVSKALDAAEKLGELQVVDQGSGRRPSLYRLAKAVNYARPTAGSGTEPVPLESRSGTENGALSHGQDSRSGTGSVPQGFRSGTDFERSGTGSVPHYPSQEASQQAQQQQRREDHSNDGHGIPDFARPLVDGLTNAGVVVRWPFVGNQWLPIHALIKKSGVTAMVNHARKAAARANVESAKYFLQGWRELPPLPQGATPPRDAPRAAWPAWCKDPDCDEKTRLRDVEHANGLRSSAPCPQCHPSRKEPAA